MKRLLGLLLLTCVLVGCTQTEPRPQSPSISDADDALSEYRDSVETWPQPLPDGDSYPETPVGFSKDEKYEEGFGTSFVAFYWRCSWMTVYLDAFDSGDVSGQTEALGYLERWRDLPWVQEHVVDSDGGWQQRIIEPARLGDPTTMRKFSQSC